MKYEEWKKIIQEHIPAFVDAAEACASVVCELFIADIAKPFGLIVLEVWGSGKTMLLNIFANMGKKFVLAEDDFTKSALISHSAKKTKEDLEKNVDLMPQIKNKVYLVRDFTTFFSKKDEDIKNILGYLTRAMDGEGLVTRSGVHGQRGYFGKHLFMLLGGSAPITSRVWGLMSQLGSRIFALYLNAPDKSDLELASQNVSEVSWKEREQICAKATAKLIKAIAKQGKALWDKESLSDPLVLAIAKISKFTAYLTGNINEDGLHLPEKPDRINHLLYNLARGHAWLCGRRRIAKPDFKVVIRVALSSMTIQRSKVVNLLLRKNGRIFTAEVMDELKCSRPIAIKYMREIRRQRVAKLFKVKGKVGRPEFELNLSEEFCWFISEEFKDLAGHTSPKSLIN